MQKNSNRNIMKFERYKKEKVKNVMVCRARLLKFSPRDEVVMVVKSCIELQVEKKVMHHTCFFLLIYISFSRQRSDAPFFYKIYIYAIATSG
jgi:hypothetical protein